MLIMFNTQATYQHRMLIAAYLTLLKVLFTDAAARFDSKLSQKSVV